MPDIGRWRSGLAGVLGPLFGLLVGCVTAPASASAMTVAIIEVAGPIPDDIAASLERALRSEGDLRVIGYGDWTNAASEAGLDPVEDRVEVGRKLRVDRFIRAKVGRKGERWRLIVQAEGPDGARLERWGARAKKVSRIDYLIQKRMITKLRPVLSAPRAAPARRSPEPVRLGLLDVRGGQQTLNRFEGIIAKARRITLVSIPQIERTAADLGADLRTTEGRMEVARALRLTAWLSLRSRVRRNRYAVSGQLYSGHDGRIIDTVEGRGGSEGSALRGMLDLLQEPLGRARAPAPDARVPPSASSRLAPPPAPRRSRASAERATQTDAAEPRIEGVVAEPTDAPAGRSYTPLTIAVGMLIQRRSYDWEDIARGDLRPYELPIGSAIAAEVRWYPAGHFTTGFVRHIGLEARFRGFVGVSSENEEDGTDFDSGSSEFFGGLRGRLPLGRHEAGLGLTFGNHSFSIDIPDGSLLVPSLDYTYVRFGADTRIALPAGLQLYAGAAWRQVLSAGAITDDEWFPDASINGAFDMHLALGWTFLDGFEVRVGTEYMHYAFSLNPDPSQVDAPAAGGALDQYISGTFDLLWSWDG